MISPDLSPGEEYWRTGMIRHTQALADPSVLPSLIRDLALFRDALADFQRRDVCCRVPYLLTDAIRRISLDAAILGVVSDVLGGDPWVMWGPNIREDVPNEAGNWHVDCESIRWPTLTVVVGLDGCRTDNATRCIPGSQLLRRHPTPRPSGETDATVREAAALRRECDRVATFEGFDNGRFYVFDAAAWHGGDPPVSNGRKLLFLHYQRAADPRIPYMRDYKQSSWFDYPAEYFCPSGSENPALYPVPAGERMHTTWRGLVYRLRHGLFRPSRAAAALPRPGAV